MWTTEIMLVGWLVDFMACQTLLGYLMAKSIFFVLFCFVLYFLQAIIWFQVTDDNLSFNNIFFYFSVLLIVFAIILGSDDVYII